MSACQSYHMLHACICTSTLIFCQYVGVSEPSLLLVCMYIHVYMYIYVSMSVCQNPNLLPNVMDVYMYIYVSMSVCQNPNLLYYCYRCTYTNTCTFMSVCRCVRTLTFCTIGIYVHELMHVHLCQYVGVSEP